MRVRQSFSPEWQLSLFSCFPQRREAQQPLICIHQTDRICLSLNLAMNCRDPTNKIRFRRGQSMKSTHSVAVSPLEISLPHCQNKLGKLGCWQIPEGFFFVFFFFAAGCDHTGTLFVSISPLPFTSTGPSFNCVCTLLSSSCSAKRYKFHLKKVASFYLLVSNEWPLIVWGGCLASSLVCFQT